MVDNICPAHNHLCLMAGRNVKVAVVVWLGLLSLSPVSGTVAVAHCSVDSSPSVQQQVQVAS